MRDNLGGLLEEALNPVLRAQRDAYAELTTMLKKLTAVSLLTDAAERREAAAIKADAAIKEREAAMKQTEAALRERELRVAALEAAAVEKVTTLRAHRARNRLLTSRRALVGRTVWKSR